MHDMSALSSSPFMIQRLEKQGDVAQYLTKACPQVASVKDSLNGIGPHTSVPNIGRVWFGLKKPCENFFHL